MSEVEGTWGTGTDFTSMEPGLGIASHMVDDMRELEPSAWVFWQPIEDAIPQAAAGKNWGSIHVPFNCTADDTLETCPIRANSKFHTIRNFTHYIRPGDHFIKVDDTSSVAAVAQSGRSATVVHVNSGTTARSVTLDLSRFGKVKPGATVTPVVTSTDGALVEGDPVRVTGRSATLTVPAKSVTSFLVDGVSGVAKDAALVQPDHVYRLQGTQSGKSLTPSDDGSGVVLRTTDPGSAQQLWRAQKLTAGAATAPATPSPAPPPASSSPYATTRPFSKTRPMEVTPPRSGSCRPPATAPGPSSTSPPADCWTSPGSRRPTVPRWRRTRLLRRRTNGGP